MTVLWVNKPASLEKTASPPKIAPMVRLGVNIDHIATLRQARKTYEPDPVWAAAEAQLGGADGITITDWLERIVEEKRGAKGG